MTRVYVNNELCTGCGLCASLCPDAFDMGENQKALPRHRDIPEYIETEYRIALENCPEGAISLD